MIMLSETKYCLTVKLYFRNIKDCKKFMAVFENHWCNVPWNPPEVVPDSLLITSEERKMLDVNPKKRAKDYLNWGFALCKSNEIGPTDEQASKLNKIMKKISIQ